MTRRPQTSTQEGIVPKGFDDYELRLGDVMRGERATLGKSLLDVQRELKIKASYIAAIENADPGAFETQGFIAGYVRSYARYLGLDPEWAFEAFRREGGLPEQQNVLVKPVDKKSLAQRAAGRGGQDGFKNTRAPYVPAGRPLFTGIEPRAVASIGVLCALIGVIGYGGWAVFREVQKVRFVPVDQGPQIVTELDPLNRATLPDEGDEIVATGPSAAALDRLYRPKALDVPVMVARDGPIAALDPSSIGALVTVPGGGERLAVSRTGPVALPGAQPPVEASPYVSPLDAAIAEALGDSGTPVLTERVETPELALVAVRPSWIRVRAANGTVIFEKILDANETYIVPQTEGIPTLRAGNAGSLYFAIDGQAYGPAGRGPSVVKNIELTAESLKGAYQVADMEADRDLARYYAEVVAQPTE